MFKNILLLEDYLEFITYGFTNPMPDSDTGPWKVTAKDIVNGKINFTTARKTTQVAYEQKLTNKSRPKVDDILLTKDGSLGRLAIVKNENLCVNQSVAVLRVNNKILPEYLYYLLSSPKYQSQMLGEADGTVIKHIYITRVAKMEVDIPSLEEQRKVIKILKSLDQKNNLNNQINQTLESIAQAIFKSWFIDFDPVRAKIAAKQEGKDAELAAMCAISGKSEAEVEQMAKEDFAELQATATLFPDELVESELGEVPKGWEYKKLKDVCRVINGRAYKNTEFKDQGIPIVRIQNLTGGGKTVFSDLDLPKDKLIEKEDFIYAWSATFGPYIWRGPKSIYHYHIWKMDVDETIISRYFLYLTMFRKTESMKSAGTGSIFTHLTKVIMESQDVLIADKAINMLFKDRIDKIFKLISIKSDEINNLENIRDALLPKLLSGELNVSGSQGEMAIT